MSWVCNLIMQVICIRYYLCLLLYGSEQMICREKERSRIRAVYMDNLKDLLDIGVMNNITNSWIRELCGAMEGVDERNDEGVLQLFGHLERMIGLLRKIHQGISRNRKLF